MSGELSKAIKKGVKLLWRESLESISFLLWLSTPPFSTKILGGFVADMFYPHQIRVNLNRLYRKGFIFKIKRGRAAFFKFKKSPKELFWPESQLLKEKKFKEKWRGKWWILIYDIPEKIKFERDNLREFLKSFSFGKLQNSCWISPYDFSLQIHNFCSRRKILKYIHLYEAKFYSGKDISKTVDEVWNLSSFSQRYQYYIKEFEEEIYRLEKENIDLKDHINRYFKLYRNYRSIICDDPFLPRDFLKNWPREKLVRAFGKLSMLLSKKAGLTVKLR